MFNREILVVGYGSLLSGHGLSRGKSRLLARDARPISIRNARRGLAKWSSHGSYLAMDIEPIDTAAPISASTELKNGGIGGLLLSFERTDARKIAEREDYSPSEFERLIDLANVVGKSLGEFLMEIANSTKFDLLAYRVRLWEMLNYTSAGYIFHPIQVDDNQIAIIAIGSGYEGSGNPGVISKRKKFEMDQLLSLEEALRVKIAGFNSKGQIGYFAECILGGLHGLDVGDLVADIDADAGWARELAEHLGPIARGERERFLEATSLDTVRYGERFSTRRPPSMAALLKLAGVV